jgi:hypothetical protein
MARLSLMPVDGTRRIPMKKFIVFYKAPIEAFQKAMESFTPEQQKQSMNDWMVWMNANQKSIADGGAPLGKTTRVDAKGVSASSNDIGGYSIVQANSPEDAAKLFGEDHPHLKMMPGAWIEITEVMPMPDM